MGTKRIAMHDWGLLPEAVVAQLMQREWRNTTHLRARLSGERPFPLRLSLKAPTGNQALTDLEHFQQFIKSWKNWQNLGQLQWQGKKYQQLGEQQVPVALQINSMPELINILGPKAEARSRHWEQLMRPLLKLNVSLSPVLVRHLIVLESMTVEESQLLAQVLPQLRPGLGQRGYIRGLPLQGVDTKFVENYQNLIVELLDSLHHDAVTHQGGLLRWLNCCANPAGWLIVRPLCQQSRKQLADLPILQMDTATLQQHPLPASNILIVENKQSGYALPDLEDTIAVFGGGRNTTWMQGEWLAHKHIAYWGDIDSWGLAILSEARERQPQLQALMMDQATLLQHQTRMVDEDKFYPSLPVVLTTTEQQLFHRLREGYFGNTRLEQERIASDYVLKSLKQWHQASESLSTHNSSTYRN